MECENCGTEHEGDFGSGRFCSLKCSRGFSTKAKRKEINEKVSLKLEPIKKKTYEFTCEVCGKSFLRKYGKKFSIPKSCSKQCSNKHSDYRKKISDIVKNKVKLGKWYGWTCNRWKGSSYPEHYFETILNDMKIFYVREKKINRFFVDFAFVEKHLILEIDGRQHDYQQEKDKNRDEIISALGWKIFRLKWYDINNEKLKEKVHEQFQNFMQLYNAPVV